MPRHLVCLMFDFDAHEAPIRLTRAEEEAVLAHGFTYDISMMAND